MRRRWPGAAVFLLALAVRAAYLHESSSGPTFHQPIIDAFEYDRAARALAAGNGLDRLFFWQPFLYPFLLSVAYSASHASIVFAKSLQAVLGSATCLLTCFLGCRTFGKREGAVAGIIVALYGPLVFYDGELLSTTLDAFWAPALILLFLAAAERKTPAWFFLTGISGILSVLTRPTYLPFFLAASAWIATGVYRSAGPRRMLGGALAPLLAGFLLVAVPVALLNHKETRRLSILPYSGTVNLYIGNHPDRCGTLTIRPGWEWRALVRVPQLHGAGDPESWSRYFREQTLAYVTEEPLSFAAGLCRKAVQFVGSREIPRNVDIYLFRRWSSVLSALVWKTGTFGFPFGVLFPLAAGGVVAARRKVPYPFWIFLLTYPASVVLVFVTGRYRVPLVPPLALLAAAGILAFADAIRERKFAGAAPAVAVAALALLITSVQGPYCEEKIDYESELHYQLGAAARRSGRPEEAYTRFSEALRLRPGYVDALNDLGALLTEAGEYGNAERLLSEAVRMRPDCAEAHHNLGFAMARQGRHAEAMREYAASIAIDPFEAECHNHFGLSLAATGALSEAAVRFSEAIRLSAGYVEAHINMGVALAAAGAPAEAIPRFEAALRLRPEDADAHFNLGNALLGQGKVEAAAMHFREALRLRPGDAAARRNLERALAGKR